MNTVKIDKYFRGMVAHRGLSGIETENTINAFTAAGNRSYYGIECDVRASKDNHLIVTHDDTLLRLGFLNIYIPSFKYEELKRFTLVDRKTGNLSDTTIIPKLSEYLTICKTYQKVAFVELKEHLTNENLDQVVDEIDKFYEFQNVNVLTFYEKYLAYLRKRKPELNLFFLTDSMKEGVFEICEKYQSHLDIDYRHVDEATIKKLHLVGLKVCVYTVDDKEVAEKLIKLGVDFITSNILE